MRIKVDTRQSEPYFHHWVYSYYRSSFFYIPYGRFINKTQILDDSNFDLNKKRSKKAVVFISNCINDRSLRLKYILKLRKLYPVVLYGRCFGLKIPNEIRQKLIKRNRYFLSFENSHCQDYNTEKYWDGLKFGAIPIVLSHSNNQDNLIPNSYIDVMNFKHPYYLAKYLRTLNKDIDLYKKYHEWRDYYKIIRDDFEMNTCEILQKINYYISKNMLNDETFLKISDTSICINANDLKSQILLL